MIGFETLLDRLGGSVAGVERASDVTATGRGGQGAGSRCSSKPAPDHAEAAATAPPGDAASASAPQPYVAVAFGPAEPSGAPGGRTSALRYAQVTCRGCGSRVRVTAAGYKGLVRRLDAADWRYAARPVEEAWCPECVAHTGDAEVRVGFGIPAIGPAARGAGVQHARPGQSALSLTAVAA